jgi:two-component system NtrC family response regulator
MSNDVPLFLLVDDDEFVLSLFCDIAEELGVKYKTAVNGQEALELANKENFDVIISDYKMPVLNGIELLETLRANGNLFPFILITGYGDKETYITAHKLGVFDIIEKPFEQDSLLRIWTNAIKTSAAMREHYESFKKMFADKDLNDLEIMKSLQQIAKLKAIKK